MATDATGTPTAKGIPKYNTSVDAPSGLGFNAAMDSIDTLLDSYVGKPSGVASGEVPVWNGTAWVRSSVTRVGTSSLGSGTADSTVYLRGDGTWAAVAAGSPSGAISAYGGSSAPSGWLLCDGTAVNRTTYAALFTAISTAYGVGDGSTTFNLPDLQGRVPVGKSGAGGHADVTTLANSDGAALANRRPKHAHTVTDPGHTHSYTDNGSGVSGNFVSGTQYWEANTVGKTTGSNTTGISVGASGLTDTPAYLVINYIIKT